MRQALADFFLSSKWIWANATARRQIRVIFVDLQRFNTEYKLQLGKWIHAGEMRSQEDQILEFRDQPYTDEIESALRPHLQTLEKLLAKRDIDYPTIPAARYGKTMEKASGKGSELFRKRWDPI
ncbi:hypothetical protein B0H14DRAFT_2366792 [Mycena olivaceomarginata]|nr:hypothetical protein B0H14DRAFT_2366792 [Mycena olivaceomarginata]